MRSSVTFTLFALIFTLLLAQYKAIDVVVDPVFFPSNRTNDAWFGYAGVGHSGNMFAVTSPKDSDKAKESGAVYLFSSSKAVASGTRISFTQNQKIYSPSPSVYDYYGNSVATDGNYLLVGSFRSELDNIHDAGLAYFYNISNNLATPMFTLSPSLPLPPSTYYGSSVCFSANTSQIAITRTGAGSAGVDVYDFQGAKRASFDSTANGFGKVVVFGNGVFFVGAPDNATVHVYSDSPAGSFSYNAPTIISSPAQNPSSTRFGHSLSVCGNFLVVGSPGNQRAYVYSLNTVSSTWDLMQEITSPSGTTSSSKFGTSVGIDGNYLVIGDPTDGPNPEYKWGAVFLYGRSNASSSFLFMNKLIGPRDRNSIGLSFGMKVSISGYSIVVPSYYASTSSLFHTGAAFHSYTNCSSGLWGSDCLPCTCTATGVCDDGLGGSGKCTRCDPGYFGENCASRCTCMNGTCNGDVSGDGKCLSCAANFFGPNCDNFCGCQANGTCSDGINGNGTCTCDYTKRWGTKCENPCNCVNGVCSRTTGACVSCATGFYGANCDPCICTNGECDDGPTGDGLCSVCNDGYFTRNCLTPCDCHVDNNLGCTIDGVCLCKPGYMLASDKKTCIVPPPPTGDLWTLMPTYGWVLLILFLVALAVIMIWLVVFLYIRKKKHEKFGGYR